MAVKPTTFLRLSAKEQLKFMLKIMNFDNISDLLNELRSLDPILSVDSSGRFTLFTDKDVFQIKKSA